MSRSLWMVLVASFALAGCNLANSQDSQYDDARNPFYKQAQQDLDNSNNAAAAEDFESALRANPKLTVAHYQLGVLYGDKLNDPISSIFHFKKFLELATGSDKTDQVKAAIDKQSQAFAATLSNTASTQSADDYAKLQAENATLKATIVQLQLKSGKHHSGAAAAAAATPPPPPAPTAAAPSVAAAPAISPPSAPAIPAVGAPAAADATAAPGAPVVPSPATPPRALPVDLSHPEATAAPADAGAPGAPPVISTAGGRTYKIVSGDSLWKISHKMYPGDTKNGIDKIKEANKDTLPDGKPLKIGQVLIIPD